MLITASGKQPITRRHVREPLDLADDVVAEVADQPARQRRQVGQLGCVVGGEHRLDSGEDAVVTRHVDVLGPVDRDDAVAQRHRQHRIPPDEREAAPSLAVLHRFEEEPVTARRRAWRRRRPASRGRRAARRTRVRPCAPWPACGTVPARTTFIASPATQAACGRSLRDAPVAPRTGRSTLVTCVSAESGVKKQLCAPGVAGAATVLGHLEQQRVAVAVVERLAHRLHVAARVALAPQLLTAAAPVHHPPLREGAAQALGVHPRQHQHVARVGILGDRRDEAAGRRT